MTINIEDELNEDIFRERLNKYTKKAFRMLPEIDKPRILDIGCGTGVPTLELARLTNGQIIGLDTDQNSLDKLNKKIKEKGLSERVETVKCSMFDMDFTDESFDVIWSEGSVSVIGFERGLRDWRRFLKPGGFLVIHDEIKNTEEKLKKIPECGYNLLGHFRLPEDAWWKEYYQPCEKRIEKLRVKYRDNPKILTVLSEEQRKIDDVKRNLELHRSVFFIMQKK